jgi:hypothetical protein
MKLEDATKLLIELLRNPDHGSFGKYGYEIYLPALLKTYFVKQGIQLQDTDQKLYELSPVFYEAGWELCRRGILRPGIKCYGEQATADGGAGNGYSITQFGRTWLQESNRDDFVPTEPERFGEILAKYKSKFGAGFHERAQQAIRCYGAHAYLACCVMCGASAESIILSAAIAKEKNETEVLKKYRSANGRHTVENILIGKARKQLQDDYRAYSTLLKYWRDEASHGRASNIEDNEAYTSLALLLRLSMFINDNWDELVNTTLGCKGQT